jgi:dTDP-4-dehydrorhamnose 3,5-epimerase
MVFQETVLKGSFIIDLNRHEDDRGSFARTYCQQEFKEQGIVAEMVQANMSTNKIKGTLRGLHYQVNPHQEEKLVRCTKGALYDVIIDLRPDSPTYREWIGVELTEHNQRALFVPKDFAHGFITLENDTTAFYMVSEFYSPGAESGIRWNDPNFSIKWPTEPKCVSEKDSNWENFTVKNKR